MYEEDNDVPDFAAPYGTMGWGENDSLFYVYDKYNIWQINPLNKINAYTVIDSEFKKLYKDVSFRYINVDKQKRFIEGGKMLVIKLFNNKTKESDYGMLSIGESSLTGEPANLILNSDLKKNTVNGILKAKDASLFVYIKETYSSSPNLFFDLHDLSGEDEVQLSNINPQQKDYNWLTAELFKWKAYNGKEATGIVYKPEDFTPKKKYPLICYFYEKLSDNLYNYQSPAPTPSRLNIPFFVSRGYIVLVPDIEYSIGHPGNSAYNYVASGARALVKAGFVDSTKIGIQGQSWGGYQVAYLITKTKLFKAAWAGAPVANMTSAYGGIRWESGLNRQFQYEKQQSRIGATLWEKPQLYIENSPLFHLNKVQTPLVIMHNDADGAVPWYQGIELFTALRRLGKPVWMLNYNNEAHNLLERKNRKDIQIREQQFFDWQLKGEKPPKWLTEGVPATDKGKDWGLQPE